MRRLIGTLVALAILTGAGAYATEPVKAPAAIGPHCFTDAGEVIPCEPTRPTPTP